jgi:hypothetical protein
MEQRALIHFFTLKGIKTNDLHAGVESVRAPEALALPTVKKWWRRFQQGRTDLFDVPMSGNLLTHDLGKEIGSMRAKPVQFVQDALSPPPNWKKDMLTGSRTPSFIS